MIRNPLRLPSNLPNKKVLSIDIVGSLAKAAFYIPQGLLEMDEKLQAIEQESVPSKYKYKIQIKLYEVGMSSTTKSHVLYVKSNVHTFISSIFDQEFFISKQKF